MENGIRTAEDEFAAAMDHIEHDEYELALPILSRLVAFVPDSDVIYEAWIEAHLGLGRHARAIAIADAGIAAGRPRGRLEFWKALAYGEQGDVEGAEAAARAAIAAEPDYVVAVSFLTDLLIQQGRDAEALELCQRAAAGHPDDEELALHAIHIAKTMQLHQVVVDSAQAFLRRFGRDVDVLSWLGSAYVDLKDYRKADHAFRDAASLEPEEVDHHVNVVMTAIAAGNQKAADAYIGKLARRDPDLAGEVGEALDAILHDTDDE